MDMKRYYEKNPHLKPQPGPSMHIIQEEEPSSLQTPQKTMSELQQIAKQVHLSKQKTINDNVSHQSEAFQDAT